MKLRQLLLLFLLLSLRKNLNPKYRRKMMRRIARLISRPTRRNRLIQTKKLLRILYLRINRR